MTDVPATTEAPLTHIEIGTIVSHRTGRGMVELMVNDTKTQMDIAKAREVAGMLLAAIEAAISDELLVAFFKTKVGMEDVNVARVLSDFREMRQGSRETVYPA